MQTIWQDIVDPDNMTYEVRAADCFLSSSLLHVTEQNVSSPINLYVLIEAMFSSLPICCMTIS